MRISKNGNTITSRAVVKNQQELARSDPDRKSRGGIKAFFGYLSAVNIEYVLTGS
jgi:hypothetical protein